MLNHGIITSKIEPKILKYWLTNEISASIIHSMAPIAPKNIAPIAPKNMAPNKHIKKN